MENLFLDEKKYKVSSIIAKLNGIKLYEAIVESKIDEVIES